MSLIIYYSIVRAPIRKGNEDTLLPLTDQNCMDRKQEFPRLQSTVKWGRSIRNPSNSATCAAASAAYAFTCRRTRSWNKTKHHKWGRKLCCFVEFMRWWLWLSVFPFNNWYAYYDLILISRNLICVSQIYRSFPFMIRWEMKPSMSGSYRIKPPTIWSERHTF